MSHCETRLIRQVRASRRLSPDGGMYRIVTATNLIVEIQRPRDAVSIWDTLGNLGRDVMNLCN